MGRSSPRGTGHGPADTVIVVPQTQTAPPDAVEGQTKSPHISPLTASLDASPRVLSRPPSPLLVSRAPPSSACRPYTPPQSPTSDEDGDKFYDADDNLIPDDQLSPPTPTAAGLSNKPKRASGVEQAPPDAYPEGASKGRMGVAPARSRNTSHATHTAVYYAAPPGRGSNKATVSPATAPPAPTSATPRVLPAPASGAPLLGSLALPVRKALLIGVDYRNSKNELKHATKDAIKSKEVLADAANFHEDNIVVIADIDDAVPFFGLGSQTPVPEKKEHKSMACGQGRGPVKDTKRFKEPTRANMIWGFRWLTDGAKAGDDLTMLFSGHCSYYNNQGPYLVTTGANGIQDMVSKQDLLDELVLKVPAGCRLKLLFDCCNSAELVDLQYCVGSMRPEPEAVQSSEEPAVTHRVTTKLTQAPAPAPGVIPALKYSPAPTGPEPTAPTHGSLYGLSQAAPAAPPPPPASFDVDSFGPSTTGSTTIGHRAPKRPGGVVAAPAPASSASSASTWFSSLMGGGNASVPAPADTAKPATSTGTGAEVRRSRQLIVEATRPPDYFRERKVGYVTPAGDVTVLAAAGARQSAFEASGKVQNGIVTYAFCTALSEYANACKVLTVRDLWRIIESAIELENTSREQRDSTKPKEKQPDPKQRTQHAELWVSQSEPLSSAAPVLDKHVF